ncbi:hypothetical protein AGABI2DRAFT_192145 [Agaricus bisporus var. bisporus H97]|uniref:hypothetical protein n=1 Tax=Agaricus bisporus var. bisporus (strain H97 / ATCC MYA-4626 / FGSC 10389) TaxID=936046 RepID=UPI00029F7B77|nr:hypothetical protein AGABI2DRAFT_192145 [Agaricus bisporus var. bisporus H97]EKV48574.1 hypothetical protein AGABI2DRAFT_192145 [Agaricus bisporus var. bisporus H97]
MTDPQPLVCVFFRLPPGQQSFTRIRDVAWVVLLPELEKLTTALETLLITNPSSTAKKALLEARKAMGSKMDPMREAMLAGRDFSRHYFKYVDSVFETKTVSPDVKRAYTIEARNTAKKVEEAQQALTEFREELEGVVFRIMSAIGGDDNNESLFIAESSQIVSTMVTAIEECKSIIQEFKEMILNITKQGFDPEAYEHNPPSDEECQLVSEKWQMLREHLHNMSLDWDLLAVRIVIPRFKVATYNDTPEDAEDARDAVALTGIPADPAHPEAPPNPPSPAKAKISFWRKFFQRLSCFSSKPF